MIMHQAHDETGKVTEQPDEFHTVLEVRTASSIGKYGVARKTLQKMVPAR